MLTQPRSDRSSVASASSFQWLLTLPLSPFRALEGVESGAGAIHDLNATAEQFNLLLSNLDLESRESVRRGLSAMEEISGSSTRLTALLETLPERAPRELVTALEQVEQSQAELRTTIRAVHDTVAQADVALARVARAADARTCRLAPRARRQHLGRGRARGPGTRPQRKVSACRRARAPEPTLRHRGLRAHGRTAAAHGGRGPRRARGRPAECRRRGALADRLLWRALALLASGFALALAYRLLLRKLRLGSPSPH